MDYQPCRHGGDSTHPPCSDADMRTLKAINTARRAQDTEVGIVLIAKRGGCRCSPEPRIKHVNGALVTMPRAHVDNLLAHGYLTRTGGAPFRPGYALTDRGRAALASWRHAQRARRHAVELDARQKVAVNG